ncbi:MAG: hypothetical protein JO235_26115 [Chroococcidiopsidaceae cyanobacterium CP_BM_RX_35]|nr:hypothetical protein [Chroococcidiopsidaceae cyanobacterium CP_BM_RX_35]
MSAKVYFLISAAIFALVSVLHIVRLFNHWSFQIGTVAVPFWGSWLGLVIGAALSIWAFRLMAEWSDSRQ